MAPMRLMRALAPAMAEAGGGRIVNVSSSAGKRGRRAGSTPPTRSRRPRCCRLAGCSPTPGPERACSERDRARPGRGRAVDRRGRPGGSDRRSHRIYPRGSARVHPRRPAARAHGSPRGDRRGDRVHVLAGSVECDRGRLVGGRRLGAGDHLSDRVGRPSRGCAAGGLDSVRSRAASPDGADVLSTRRVESGGPLPGPLAARQRLGGDPRVRVARRPGEPSHAATFFAGLDARALDYTAAAKAPDPLVADPPFHPSFEDRVGAPDRVFAALDEAAFEHQVATWRRQLAAAGAAEFDLLHLHHLTPINEAAERDFPEVPRIGHLHGTELLMLREIEQGSPPAGSTPALGRSACAPGRAAARGCSCLTGRGAAGAAPARRRARAGGLGAERVRPRRVCQAPARAGGTHRALAALAGRGAARWDESGRPGSIAYRERDLEAFKAGGPCCSTSDASRRSSASRSSFARTRARARATSAARRSYCWAASPASGRASTRWPRRRTGARDVFLAGWRGHDDLPGPECGRSARAAIGPRAVRCGAGGGDGLRLPVLAVDAHGPAEIVDAGETGGSSRPTTRTRSQRRSSRRSTALPSAAGAAIWPTRRLARATPGPRSRTARVYDEVRAGRPATAGMHTLVQG